MLNTSFTETGFVHPSLAVRAGEIESTRRLNQHIEAHQEAERIFASFIVDQCFVDEQRSANRQRLIGLAQELFLFGEAS